MYVPEKIIMEHSGHISRGVQSYERTTALQQRVVSDVLSDITTTSSVTTNCNDARSTALVSIDDNSNEEFLDKLFSCVPCASTSASANRCDDTDVQKAFQFSNMQGCTFKVTIYNPQ